MPVADPVRPRKPPERTRKARPTGHQGPQPKPERDREPLICHLLEDGSSLSICGRPNAWGLPASQTEDPRRTPCESCGYQRCPECLMQSGLL